MRSIKITIKMMSAITLTSISTSSIVACEYDSIKVPDLNCRYAKLLGWYNSDNSISLIQQKLSYDSNNEKYLIIADDSLITPDNLFKNQLLITGSTSKKYKARNEHAAAFLQELGYTSGNENQDYSSYDVNEISNLIAKVRNSNPGKITENNQNDFQVSDGTCQIDIVNKDDKNDKLITSYTINTSKNNQLGINNIIITNIIFNKSTLKLTTEEGFRQGNPITSFKLKFKSDDKQKQFDELVKLLNTKISTQFFSDSNTWTPVTGNFPNSKVFLEIHFGNVNIHRIDCGIAPTE